MKNWIFSGVILSLILIAGVMEATPPDSIKINLDSDATLSVMVFHPVKKNPSNHFIKYLIVKLNGNQIIKQEFQSQTNTARQEAKYIIIDAKPGDKIVVTGDCSLYGEMIQELALPPEKSSGSK